MKKIFLGLSVALIMFLASCSYDSNKTYIVEGLVENVSADSIISKHIVTKRLIWKNGVCPARGLGESIYSSDIWFLCPAERIPDNIRQCKIELVYRIKNLKRPVIVYVLDIRILATK